jgi:hypothetical protein
MAAEASPELLLKTNLAFLGPAAFSPDERTLAVCNPIPLRWEVASYALASGQVVVFPKAHANLIRSISFSPDGNQVAFDWNGPSICGSAFPAAMVHAASIPIVRQTTNVKAPIFVST